MKTILLVEDNPDDTTLTMRALGLLPVRCRVIVARDGKEALSHIANGSARSDDSVELPALVILDLDMPRLSGIEILRRIRTDPRSRRLHVVMLSGAYSPHDVAACRSLGVNACLEKPLRPGQLTEVVRALGHL